MSSLAPAVVIKPIGSLQRPEILSHLLSLSQEDRQGRFLAVATDQYVSEYVESIVFARDVLMGASVDGKLVGLAHAAVFLDGVGELAMPKAVAKASAATCCALCWQSHNGQE